MLSKRRWLGAVLAVLAVRLGAADVEVKSRRAVAARRRRCSVETHRPSRRC